MSGQHCEAPPSSRARTIQCPASVSMELRFPSEEGEEAREGTAAHWAGLEQWFKQGVMPGLGTLAPNGVAITREMQEGAEILADAIRATIEPYGLGVNDVAIEVPAAMGNRIHPRVWGTPDARAWTQKSYHPGERLRLFVFDYKFGFEVVEAFENWQGIDYLAGALNTVPPTMDAEIDCEFVVIQPRAFHRQGPVRHWKVSALDLRPMWARSAAAVTEAFGDNPRLIAGPECRHCSARAHCEALQREGYAAMSVAYQAQPLTLGPAERGIELEFVTRAYEALKARKSGLEAEVEAGLRRGEQTPGWSLTSGQSRTVWSQPPEIVIGLGKMLNLDLAKPAEPITPKQAVKAGLPAELLKTYASDVPGAHKLTRDDGTAARRVFSGQAS